MSDVLTVVAGWDLPNGVIDSVEPFDVARHLPQVVRHRLTGVLEAAMAEGAIVVDRPERVHDAHRDAMARSLLLEDALLDIDDALAAAGIERRVLKGAALAHLDGHPERRDFGDNDVLVRPDQLPAAASALESRGATRLQAPVSPTWEQRFAKSVTLRWHDTEVDLHRTLAPGPYGLTIDGDRLFAGSATFALAGIELATLSAEHHLVHAAIHVALGDIEPRLGNVRDTALLLAHPDLDEDAVIRVVVEWRLEAPFALGVGAAAELGAAATGVVEWARRFTPTRGDQALLRSYATRDGRFRRQAWASLRVLGWRDRVAYARSLASRRR